MSFFNPSKSAIEKTSAFAMPGAVAGELMDSFNRPNQFGKIKAGVAAASGALKYGAAGAQFGPVGAAAGALIGGTLGLLSAKKGNQEAANAEAQFNINEKRSLATQSAISYGQNSQFGEAGRSWFGYGGSMAPVRKKMLRPDNGSLKHFTEHDFMVKGPKHKNGGVGMSAHGAELEGGETGTTFPMNGEDEQTGGAPYIFSVRQRDPVSGKTFAAAHKDMATRAGKAESHGGIEAQRTSSVLRSRITKLAERQELLNEMRRSKYEQSLLNYT